MMCSRCKGTETCSCLYDLPDFMFEHHLNPAVAEDIENWDVRCRDCDHVIHLVD